MITISKLRTSIRQRIRGSGEDWDFVFYSAINDVIQDMIVKTIIEVEAIDEDTPPTTIDIDAAYYKAFIEGINYYMQKSAKWARTDENVSMAEYERALADAQMFAIEEAESPVSLDYED